MKKFFVLFFSLLFSSFSVSSLYASSAPQSLGIIISPPVFSNLTANPGSVISNVIKVYNTSPSPLNVLMEKDNYTAVGDNGEVKLQNPNVNDQYSLASWITVSPTSLDILPNSYKYVHFTINVPINAQPGSRFASIVAFVSGSNNPTGSGVGTKIGSLILLTISGNANVSANLLSFSSSPTISQGGNINFIQKIKDTGNVTLKPTGRIIITNMFGQKVATIPIESRDVIPSAVRKTEEQFSTKNLFGEYTASLLVNYNSEGKGGNLSATSTFWVIPVDEILVIIIIIIIIFIFRKNIQRSLKAFFSKN